MGCSFFRNMKAQISCVMPAMNLRPEGRSCSCHLGSVKSIHRLLATDSSCEIHSCTGLPVMCDIPFAMELLESFIELVTESLRLIVLGDFNLF